MHPALNIMVKAARRASQIINRASQDIEHLQVTSKKQNDFVTEVDKAAEAAIIKVLREAYPDYGILAEESGQALGDGAGNDYQWIIDPIDGTTNFIHGFPQYSVSIALAYKGQPNQAVVYDTVRNEMFTASKGGGAFLNERRIRVADIESVKMVQVEPLAEFGGWGWRWTPVGGLGVVARAGEGILVVLRDGRLQEEVPGAEASSDRLLALAMKGKEGHVA